MRCPQPLLRPSRFGPKPECQHTPKAGLLPQPETCRKTMRAQALRHKAQPDLILQNDRADAGGPATDHRLGLMLVCAHPAIDPAARASLILQTVLGIDAAAIARAFLVDPADMPDRLAAVLDAIYAAFGKGWDSLDTPEAPDALTGEAICLARLVADQMPDQPEPKGLLALMLYCGARRRARRDAEGRFVPLDRQDFRLWDRGRIIEAEGLLTSAARGPLWSLPMRGRNPVGSHSRPGDGAVEPSGTPTVVRLAGIPFGRHWRQNQSGACPR